MTYLRKIISSTNGDELDAFSNNRVAPPSFVADGQLTYDLQPLLYEQITAGDGTVTHDATNRCARLRINTATASGENAIMQSFQHYRYQAGRAQEVFITFCFNADTGVAGVRRFAEYGEGSNGIGFQLTSAGKALFINSDTASGDQLVLQGDWNLDTLDGSGPSGITLDTSKTQILVMDIQALYVGRVRCGFDIDGVIYWVHEFRNANVHAVPYIQSANLPIRVGIESTAATETDDDMLFICSCVLSRGGQDRVAGYNFSVAGTVTAVSGARTHLLSVRPKTVFNGITNRVEFVLEDIEVIATGSSPIYWELVLGQALTTPTYADANAVYSAFEYAEAETLSGNPAIVIASGFVAASVQSKSSTDRSINNRYPLTLDAAGAVRDLGTLTLLVTGIGGASACRGQMHWRELR